MARIISEVVKAAAFKAGAMPTRAPVMERRLVETAKKLAVAATPERMAMDHLVQAKRALAKTHRESSPVIRLIDQAFKGLVNVAVMPVRPVPAWVVPARPVPAILEEPTIRTEERW